MKIIYAPECRKTNPNKANLLDAQMNVKSFHTVDYENKSNWTLGENKPKQTQSVVSLSNLFQTQSEAEIPTVELL